MSEEIYVNISNFPNYQISNFGNVKNILTGRMLKGTLSCGYMRVKLINDDCSSCHLIHRLIANEFIPNPENKRCVDHEDRNRLNNNISNLRWATHVENSQNTSITSKNTSGTVGVSWEKRRNVWYASITVNGLNKFLGSFVLKEDAIKARTNAEILYFREFRSII